MEQSNFLSLPVDVTRSIFANLTPLELVNVRAACKQTKKHVDGHNFDQRQTYADRLASEIWFHFLSLIEEKKKEMPRSEDLQLFFSSMRLVNSTEKQMLLYLERIRLGVEMRFQHVSANDPYYLDSSYSGRFNSNVTLASTDRSIAILKESLSSQEDNLEKTSQKTSRLIDPGFTELKGLIRGLKNLKDLPQMVETYSNFLMDRIFTKEASATLPVIKELYTYKMKSLSFDMLKEPLIKAVTRAFEAPESYHPLNLKEVDEHFKNLTIAMLEKEKITYSQENLPEYIALTKRILGPRNTDTPHTPICSRDREKALSMTIGDLSLGKTSFTQLERKLT